MTAARDGEREPRAFTRAELDDAAKALGERLGLDLRGVRLLKFTHNATYLSPRDGIVVRLVGSIAMYHRADKVVRVARWLEAHDFPAVRLVGDIDQPVRDDGFVATIWHAIPTTGPPPSTGDLGRMLRQLHSLPPPPRPLPAWQPMDDVRRRLAHTEELEAGDLQFLHDQADELDAKLPDLPTALTAGPIHGDAFLGNLIPGPEGPVLCDFDSTSTGPREWDLTPVAVGHLRFGDRASAHDELVRSYGFDVTTSPAFPTLRRIRELRITTSVVPVLRTNPSIVDQFKVRLETLKTGDETTRWTRY